MRPTITAAIIALMIGVFPFAWAGAAPVTAVAAPAPSSAPPPTPVAAPAPAVVDQAAAASSALDVAQQALGPLQSQAETSSNDARLAALGNQAAAIQAQAQAVASARASDLASVSRALKAVTPRGHRAPTAAQRAAQAPLLAQSATLQGQLKQAQIVAAAASSAFNLVAERRREGFSARVLEQSASPLSPDFWASLADVADTDLVRLTSVAMDASAAAWQAPEPRGLGGLFMGLVVAALLVGPIRQWLEKLGRRKSGEAVHPGFARTAAALWIAVIDTAMPALGAVAVRFGAQWGGLLSDKADALAGAAVVAVGWAAAILALGRVLATDADKSHRLLSVPEDATGRIQVSLIAVASVTAAGFLLSRLNYVVGASVAATIASNCIVALAYVGVAGLILVSFGRRVTAPAQTAQTRRESLRSPVWSLVSLALTTAIIVTVGAVFAGYTTLAVLTAGQIFWLSLIAAVTYLVLRFTDDLCGVLFAERGAAALALFVLFRLRRSTIAQTGVLISAGLQLLILVGALSLSLTPFGQSGDLLFAHLGQLGGVIHFGSATISPAAVAAGLATLALGMGLVHFIQGWITRRYLPVTDWDAGVRNSVITGVGYLGVGIAVICALAAMGLGFNQIALIASALSVGIGFGLQTVVQNFVSGVILLVERPVKVGDWVNVGGVEGDIRRIRVRATEIQTFDRSTVIVPNSDLVTKSVQNKTLGDPRGRILLPLSIANPTDAAKAKGLIEGVCQREPRVLQDPAPKIYIDSLAAGGSVNFNCYIYVMSQRDVYAVRSDLYFQLLEDFQKNGVPFVGTGGPTNVIVEPGPEMAAILTAARSGAEASPPTQATGEGE
jgi:small-conductance mechanosensitive channel